MSWGRRVLGEHIRIQYHDASCMRGSLIRKADGNPRIENEIINQDSFYGNLNAW